MFTVAPANRSLAAVPPTSARASSTHRAQPGSCEIGGGDEAVVASADHDRVVVVARPGAGPGHVLDCRHDLPVSIRHSLSRSAAHGLAWRCVIPITSTRRTPGPRHRPRPRRPEHPRPAARGDRAARPTPAVQHRSPDRRARGDDGGGAGRRGTRRVDAPAARLHEVERARLVGRHDLAVGNHAVVGARRHRAVRGDDARPQARVHERPRRQLRTGRRGQP